MHDFASKRLKVPAEIKPLIDEIRLRSPDSIWLFGSQARGDNRADSDWDILVALPDDATPELLDPLVGWTIQHEVGIPATILSTTSSELAGKLGFAEYDRVRRCAGRAPTGCLTHRTMASALRLANGCITDARLHESTVQGSPNSRHRCRGFCPRCVEPARSH
ncbi:nucleotidyltransferase domain-containing protein [Mesorhizobium sp.]|uniref:nucleotidyltransferase domain-containing protein n=1 Tax=Mesorhizobium sp. TaxID=1871066 RepID=UPI000FE5A90A|nr:MAG: nucleotidyltransferase domain-containing protein [Mesorhizobium sp.]